MIVTADLISHRRRGETWVAGRGRIFGVDITWQSQGQPERELGLFGMNAFGPGGCYTSGCIPHPRPPWNVIPLPAQIANPDRNGFPPEGTSADNGRAFLLPPGQYRIYVVADGGPVTVTLPLRGAPSGISRLSPTAPSGAGVISTPSTDLLPNTYSAGATHSLNGGGVIVTTRTRSYPGYSPVVSDDGICTYVAASNNVAASKPPSGRYVSGCPGGTLVDDGDTVITPGLGDSAEAFADMWFVDRAPSTRLWCGVGQYSYGVDVPNYSSPTTTLWLPLS